MTAIRAKAHGPALFLILASIALALAVGFYFGSTSTSPVDSLRQIQTQLLSHDGSKGKSCAPQGNYGHVKNLPPHCTP